jgi:D-lactate dehydrogenase
MNITFTSLRKDEKEFFEKHLKEHSLKLYENPIDKIPLKDIKKTEILVVFVFDKLGRDILSQLPDLKLIITRSAGIDHIDLDYCKEKGIHVAHMPAYSPKSIAEHTFALLLNLTRRIKTTQKKEEKIDFSQGEDLIGIDLDQLTIGVIGTGRIGTQTALLALAFGMEVLAFDIKENPMLKEKGVKYLSFDEIIKKSDVITLHVPYTPKTHHLINKETVAKMKEGVYIINTSRGKVVDTDAIYEGVVTGKIKGLALDVFEDEEILILKRFEEGKGSDKNLKILRLLSFDNVIITPHIAYFTKKAIENIKNCTLEAITLFVKGEDLGRFKVL